MADILAQPHCVNHSSDGPVSMPDRNLSITVSVNVLTPGAPFTNMV